MAPQPFASPSFSEDGLIPLAAFGCGKCVHVHYMCLDPEQAERLREMGVCEGRCVSVLQNADKLIVRAGGSRVGLHRTLAESLFGTEVQEERMDALRRSSMKEWLKIQAIRLWSARRPGLRGRKLVPVESRYAEAARQ